MSAVSGRGGTALAGSGAGARWGARENTRAKATSKIVSPNAAAAASAAVPQAQRGMAVPRVQLQIKAPASLNLDSGATMDAAARAPVNPADPPEAETAPERAPELTAEISSATAAPPLELHLTQEAPGPLQAPEAKQDGGGFQPEGLRTLLKQLGVFQSQSLEQLLPALQILGLAVVAGVGLKLTGAVLGAINELPLLGQLLQLVGLVTAIQFLARNALQQQKRAALLARIEQIKTNLLG